VTDSGFDGVGKALLQAILEISYLLLGGIDLGL
jgi:hypothetical protein